MNTNPHKIPTGSLRRPKVDPQAAKGPRAKRANADAGPKIFSKTDSEPKTYLRRVGLFRRVQKYGQTLKVADYECTRCNSGRISEYRSCDVESGRKKSCGCLRDDKSRDRMRKMWALSKQNR